MDIPVSDRGDGNDHEIEGVDKRLLFKEHKTEDPNRHDAQEGDKIKFQTSANGVHSETLTLDGFVKSPSAALRFNFVVAAHLVSALQRRSFCAPGIVGASGRSPENGRPAGRPYKRNHHLGDFLRDQQPSVEKLESETGSQVPTSRALLLS